MKNNSNKNVANDLIERYIYAVTKRMQKETRDDIACELRSLIDDMLTERCKGIVPTEKDIVVVLTELGSPQSLFEKYSNTKNCMIGGAHYQTYKFVLPIVLSAVMLSMILIVITKTIVSPEENTTWNEIALKFADVILSAYVSAYMLVTVLFELLYMLDIKISHSYDLYKLPPVPTKNKMIKKWQPISMICFIVVFLVMFLVAPQIFGAFLEDGKFISIFDVSIIRNVWYIITLFAITGIIREIIKLIEGVYNKKVMIVSLIADIVSAILAFAWLLNSKIISHDFINSIGEIFSDDAHFIGIVFSNFQYFFLAVIVFALILDSIEAIIRFKK